MVNHALLNKYLPNYTFREYHDIIIASDSINDVYDIGRDVNLANSQVIPVLFKLRRLPINRMNALGFIAAMKFSIIEENYPIERLVGYWKSDKIELVNHPNDFIGYKKNAQLKVAFSFQYKQLNDNQVQVSTETRVLCISIKEKLLFPLYWVSIRPFSGLIRKEILKLIKYETESFDNIKKRNITNNIEKQNIANNIKSEMVINVPPYILIPIRGYFRIASTVMPSLAVTTFKYLLSHIPRKSLKTIEKKYLMGATTVIFQCDDNKLTGYSFGEGPTILMVHGLLGNSANFRFIIQALVSNGYKVIAFDSENHGNSPDGVSFSKRTISNLEEVIRQIGDIHAIVSHSAGTYLVMMALLNFPSGNILNKCIYIAAYPSIDTTLRTFMNYFGVSMKIYPQLCVWMEEIGGIPFEEQSINNLLPKHQTPSSPACLFMHDTNDRQISYSLVNDMLSEVSNTERYITSDLGHYRILKDQQCIQRIVDFVKH